MVKMSTMYSLLHIPRGAGLELSRSGWHWQRENLAVTTSGLQPPEGDAAASPVGELAGARGWHRGSGLAKPAAATGAPVHSAQGTAGAAAAAPPAPLFAFALAPFFGRAAPGSEPCAPLRPLARSSSSSRSRRACLSTVARSF